MTRQVCPFHPDEDVVGSPSGEGGIDFECTRSGHPTSGPYSWLAVPEPLGISEIGGLADELGIPAELVAIVGRYRGQWVEYGVVEAAYAERQPENFAFLVDRYGHTAIAEKRYTVSSFLAGVLGRLARTGEVIHHSGPATGRWSYNPVISWWTVAPEPDWSQRLSWEQIGHSMEYVQGSVE